MDRDEGSRPREDQVQDEPQGRDGEGDLPRQPPAPLRSYAVDPGPTPAERRAFTLLPWAWVVVFVLAGIILYGVFR